MGNHYQLEGIDYYVTAPNKEIAALFCRKHHWGVTTDNLIQVERIPRNAAHHINYYDENH